MPAIPAPTASRAERDRFVLSLRPPRGDHDPWQPQGAFVEAERDRDGRIVRVATLLLTGRECPWRCVMCDLWQHTTIADTPRGALAAQIDAALDRLALDRAAAGHAKIYNAGSFFDPRAVPECDYEAMAGRFAGFTHLVVESHPALVGPRVIRWQDALARAAGPRPAPTLEIAMGLETAHEAALDQLHKGFTLDGFRRAADRARALGAAVRVFLLVGVPFIPPAEQDEWVARSIEAAFDCGAAVVSLVPTRLGNGALEALQAAGIFAPPSLADLERALEHALPQARGRVFADLWDLDRFSTCALCLDARRERLRSMNLAQRLLPPHRCTACRQAAAV